jgi:hypothetical protein
MKEYQIIRHGENFIRKIDKLPKGKKLSVNSFIIGHSETGHHHVLESKDQFTVIEPKNLDDNIFFELLGSGKVVHKKTVNRHNDLGLAPGVYEVTHKKEYSPFTKLMEKVWD